MPMIEIEEITNFVQRPVSVSCWPPKTVDAPFPCPPIQKQFKNNSFKYEKFGDKFITCR